MESYQDLLEIDLQVGAVREDVEGEVAEPIHVDSPYIDFESARKGSKNTNRAQDFFQKKTKSNRFQFLAPAGRDFRDCASRIKIQNDQYTNQTPFSQIYPTGTWKRPIGTMPNVAFVPDASIFRISARFRD